MVALRKDRPLQFQNEKSQLSAKAAQVKRQIIYDCRENDVSFDCRIIRILLSVNWLTGKRPE